MDSVRISSRAPDVSVVIPAHNEMGTIAEVVRRVDACLDARGWSKEILIGDSACTDGTVLAAVATGLPIRVVSAVEPGKGRILTRAFLQSRGRVLAFIDADLDLFPEELPRLIDEVRAGATCAVGVKTHTARASRPLSRRIGSFLVNAAARIVLRTGLTDHQTGMKAFDGDALRAILPEVVETGWLWDTEVLWRLKSAGGSVTEVAVTLSYSGFTDVRHLNSVDGARQVLAMYRRVGLFGGLGERSVGGPHVPPGPGDGVEAA